VKIIVTGSRAFIYSTVVMKVLDEKNADVVIHGGCTLGADTRAETWCTRRQRDSHIYRARWDAQGPAAGPKRNLRMLLANPGTPVVAFLTGASPGTRDCVRRANELKHLVEVYNHQGTQIALYEEGRLVRGIDVAA